MLTLNCSWNMVSHFRHHEVSSEGHSQCQLFQSDREKTVHLASHRFCPLREGINYRSSLVADLLCNHRGKHKPCKMFTRCGTKVIEEVIKLALAEPQPFEASCFMMLC